MKRVTDAQLEAVVKRLNEMTNSPVEPYAKTVVGRYANVGNYHLDYAYGKVRLVRMSNVSGGINTITQLGTKRECLSEIFAFRDGYLAALANFHKN